MIDIIVPFYRTNFNYFAEMIQSLKQQSIFYKCNLIFINDDFNDNLLNLYCNKLNLINYIIIDNFENKGPGYSRNKGINNSKNPYIWFMDSDDIIPDDKTLLEDFLNILSQNNELDYVFGMCDDTHEILHKNFKEDILFNNGRNHENTFKGVLFKSSFLKNNLIYFNDKFFYGEENLFILLLELKSGYNYFSKRLSYITKKREISMLNCTNEPIINLFHELNLALIRLVDQHSLIKDKLLKKVDLNLLYNSFLSINQNNEFEYKIGYLYFIIINNYIKHYNLNIILHSDIPNIIKFYNLEKNINYLEILNNLENYYQKANNKNCKFLDDHSDHWLNDCPWHHKYLYFL